MSEKVKEKIIDSDALVLETNHDVDMLRVGHYPWSIKRRILGDKGIYPTKPREKRSVT